MKIKPHHNKFITKKRLVFVSCILVIGLLVIPNLKGGLKALGLLERDFIPSTSGALYETQNHPFLARIGDKNDPQLVRLEYQLNDLTFSEQVAKGVTPVVTPALLPPESATVAATLQDQVAALEASVSGVQSEALKMTGNTSQSYFGPHETVRQHQVFGGDVNYYLLGEKLVQEWQLVDKINQIQLVFKSNKSSLHIDPSGTWNITDTHGNKVVVTMQVFAANGTPLSLPETTVQDIAPSGIDTPVSLILPPDAVANYATQFPLRVVRTFTPQSTSQTAAPSPEAISVGPQPRFIARFADTLLVGDPQAQTIFRLSGGTSEPLLSGYALTGLACSSTTCYLATDHQLFQFDPVQFLSEPDIAKRADALEAIITDFPISSLTASSTTLFATSNANPNGTLYQKTPTGFTPSLTGLVFPTQSSASPDNSLNTLLAGGQIWYQTPATTWRPLNFPLPPKLLAAGPNRQLYFTVTYPRTGEDIVLRLTPDTNQLEVLAKVSGTFSALSLSSDTLYLGIPGTTTGYLWPIPLADSRWVTTQEFSTQ